jgi:hypothetical protein
MARKPGFVLAVESSDASTYLLDFATREVPLGVAA